jgi:GNAT superfamily N-acetyltransferase
VGDAAIDAVIDAARKIARVTVTAIDNAGARIRALTVADVDSLLHVQTVCYGDGYQESAEVFARRLACAHQCALGVVRAGESALQAYAVAYWSHWGKVTPLNGDFAPPQPGVPQLLYVHDMSVLPAMAGQGVARQLLAQLLHSARARGVQQAALVSVQGSQAYWQRQGFEVQDVVDAQQRAHLATYGADAVYMVAAL